jgi:hypothetical protein
MAITNAEGSGTTVNGATMSQPLFWLSRSDQRIS